LKTKRKTPVPTRTRWKNLTNDFAKNELFPGKSGLSEEIDGLKKKIVAKENESRNENDEKKKKMVKEHIKKLKDELVEKRFERRDYIYPHGWLMKVKKLAEQMEEGKGRVRVSLRVERILPAQHGEKELTVTAYIAGEDTVRKKPPTAGNQK